MGLVYSVTPSSLVGPKTCIDGITIPQTDILRNAQYAYLRVNRGALHLQLSTFFGTCDLLDFGIFQLGPTISNEISFLGYILKKLCAIFQPQTSIFYFHFRQNCCRVKITSSIWHFLCLGYSYSIYAGFGT